MMLTATLRCARQVRRSGWPATVGRQFAKQPTQSYHGAKSETVPIESKTAAHSAAKPLVHDEVTPICIYKSKGILPLRMLQRLKIWHIGAMAALSGVKAIPMIINRSGIVHKGGHIAGFVDEPVAVTAGAVLCLSGAIVVASNRLAQQYVGMVYVVPGANMLRISTLDFWGKRVDKDYGFQTLVPPYRHLPMERLSQYRKKRIFTRLEFTSGDVYMLDHRFGTVVDPVLFNDMMGITRS